MQRQRANNPEKLQWKQIKHTIRKRAMLTFRQIEFDIKTNVNEIDILDAIFNLKNDYKPFRKQNDSTLYVHI